MASLDSLPSDQRAVLELVLRRGRSYDQIADMLSIDRAGVRARALEAFDALGPQSRVPARRRALITDYLLGALPERVADEVHGHLAESAAERAWARVIASELEPVAAQPLPDIPVDGGRPREPDGGAERDGAAEPVRASRPARSAQRRREPGRPARAARKPAAAGEGPARPSSRRGGAVLLALGGLVVLAIVLVLIFSGGGAGPHHPSVSAQGHGSTAGSPGPTGTTGSTGTTPRPLAQINLNAPGGGKAKGVAEVLREGGKTGIAIVAQGLAPNTTRPPNAYAVWLYNSPGDSHILGFHNPGVGKNGRLQTAGGLPSNASHYQKLLITLETQSNPKTPGQIVLEGALVGVS